MSMATRFLSLSRNTLTKNHSFLSRSYTASSSSNLSVSLLIRLRPLVAASNLHCSLSPSFTGFRAFSTRSTQTSLNDSNPNWSNRPPKETILLDGCDFEHWLVVLEKPDESATRDEIIQTYVKTLAQIVGSEQEAKMKIYSVSTKHYFAFGAFVNEELSYKLKELPNVRWVLPDSYLDVRNKDYGGEPFINGEAVPYDPKYHEEWVRNNAKAMDRNRRNDRPRNFDRSRNFDRRRQDVQPQGGGITPQGGGMRPQGGAPPPGGFNMGGPPNILPQGGGMPPHGGHHPPPGGLNSMAGSPNMGVNPNHSSGAPNPGWQANAQNFQGGGGGYLPHNSQGPPPNYQGPPQNSQSPPPNYQGPHGGGCFPPQNYQGLPQGGGGYPPQHSQGPPPNYPGHQGGAAGFPAQHHSQGSPAYYQNSQGPPPSYQNNGSQNNMGGAQPLQPGGKQYQAQDMPSPPPPRNF